MGAQSSSPASSKVPSRDECLKAFAAGASRGRGPYRLSWALWESICGCLTFREHLCFAEVSKSWLGVARSGSPRCWPPERVSLPHESHVWNAIKARCPLRDCELGFMKDLGRMDESIFEPFVAAFPQLTSLDVKEPTRGWMMLPPEGAWLDALARLPQLKQLAVAGKGEHYRVRELTRLRQLPLTSLKLKSMHLSYEPVLSIFAESSMPLTALDLCARLTFADCRDIAKLPLRSLRLLTPAPVPYRLPESLTELRFAAESGRSLEGVEYLPRMLAATKVSSIHASFVALRPAWIAELSAGVGRQLKTVAINGCPGFSGEHLATLCEGARSLELVVLSGLSHLADDDIALLQQLPALRILEVKGCARMTAAFLCHCVSLHRLELLSADVGTKVALTWHDMAQLTGMPSLLSLHLRCNMGLKRASDAELRQLFVSGKSEDRTVSVRISESECQ